VVSYCLIHMAIEMTSEGGVLFCHPLFCRA
jgi:hypothetical protein